MKKKLLTLFLLFLASNICFADSYYNSPSQSSSAIQNDAVIPNDSIIKSDADYTSTSSPAYTAEIYKLLKLTKIYPNDLKVHLKLAKAYDNGGFVKESNDEYSYIITNAKNNKEILDELERIFVYKTSLNPYFDRLYIILGMIYQAQGKYQQAFDEFKKAIELNPSSIPQKVALASLYVDQKDYIKAMQVYDTILLAYPHNISVRIQKANVLNLMGLKDKAISEYKTVLSMQPTNFEAKIALYEILKPTMSSDEILKVLYKEYANAPLGVTAYYKLASDLHLAKKYDDAMNFYKLIISIDPNCSKAYIDLADIYNETGNNDAVKVILDSAQKVLPNDAEIKKKYDSYIADQQKVAQLNASDLIKKGLYDEAIKIYSTVNPPTVESLIGIASCYQYQAKYNEALDYLNKALAIDSTNPEVYYNFGFLYLNKEDYSSAKTYLNKSLELNPGNQKAKKLLAFIVDQEINKLATQILNEYDQKNYTKAMILIDEMLKINPNIADGHYYKGLVYTAMAKNLQAIVEFENTLKYDKHYVMAYYSLAVAYDLVKKHKEALINYNKFLSLSKEENEYTAYAKKRAAKIK